MRKILIDCGEERVRTALLENGKLTEIIIDDQNHASLAGRVYLGLVKEILACKFAFVDIGLKQNTFLQLSDNREQGLTIKKGQKLLVQVLKDSIGEKGPVVTSMLSVTGKSLVVFRLNNREGKSLLGISKKIEDQKERERLKNIAGEITPIGYGIILRTSSRDKGREELQSELELLTYKLEDIVQRGQYMLPPALVHKENGLFSAALKELLSEDVEEIIVNQPQALEEAKIISDEYFRKGPCPVTYYEGAWPLFNQYGLEAQIAKALNKNIWLPSGGTITIEQTEACVVIDVNSGKFSGYKDHEKSVSKTNKEAAVEIFRQLRIRNLSGIIIIDFIKMKTEEEKEELLELLRQEAKKDRLAVTVAGMTNLGLVELTRKKTRETLSKILSNSYTERGKHYPPLSPISR